MANARFPLKSFMTFALLVSVCVLSSCNSSPVGVSTTDSFNATQSSKVDCPDKELLAQQIVDVLDKNCPRYFPFRHWGAENSCEKSTIGKMLDSYKGCFSGAEMKEIRARIHELRETPDETKRDDHDLRQE